MCLFLSHFSLYHPLCPPSYPPLCLANAAAVYILKAAGLYGLPEPSGSIHVDEIAHAERKRQMLSAW